MTSLCGYLGIALILKAIRISASHLTGDTTLKTADSQCMAIAAELAELADADGVAFQQFIDALKLPHESAVDKDARHKAVSAAAIKCSDTAISALEHGNRVEAIAAAVLPTISKSIQQDLAAGRQLIAVMGNVSILNANADLDSIQDVDARQRLKMRYDAAVLAYQKGSR